MKQPRQYAYAQTRIQAAYARLPGPAFWQEVEGLEGRAALQKIQASGLAVALEGLPPTAPAREIEDHIRHHLRQQILLTADWAPPAWRPAVHDVAVLPDLPALDAYWRGHLPATSLAGDLKEQLEQAGRAKHRLERLQDRLKNRPDQPLRVLWLDEWRPLWASLPGSGSVARLVEHMEQHLAQFSRLPAEDAWPARDRLWAVMAHTLHMHAFEPVVLFAYLVLAALALERLRAAWLGRLLFAARTDNV
jgi:hypothetical protein